MNDRLADKPPKTPQGVVEILKKRGLEIKDEGEAERHLQFISYYRLRAYWEEFEEGKDVPRIEDGSPFKKGASFDDGLDIYLFDKELRILVLDAIERIEIAMRACWAQYMVMKYGHHGYLDESNYQCTKEFKSASKKLMNEYSRQSNKAGGLELPHQLLYSVSSDKTASNLPVVWAVVEVMSFNSLSRWIENLHEEDIREISSLFGIGGCGVVSIGYHLAGIRNTCAHHGRLWNKPVSGIRQIPTQDLPQDLQKSTHEDKRHLIYNTLTLICHLFSTIKLKDKNRWRNRIVDLIDQYKSVSPDCLGKPKNWIPDCMGFPEDWRTRPVWAGKETEQ